jgi:hypothetical protein
VSLSFPEWHARWPDWPGHGRLAGFEALPQRDQDACWDDLAEQCRRWTDAEYLLEQRRYEEWPAPKRHQRVQRSTAATSTRPGVVVVSSTDDPLKAVPPAVYFEAIAGIVVPPNGWVSCPMPDHPDEHPSCKVTIRTGAAGRAGRVARSSTWRQHCTASPRGGAATGSYAT